MFLGLLEDSFRATTEALDTDSRVKRSRMLPGDIDENLGEKLEAVRFAQKALKDHVNTCPRCAREANEAV